MACKRTLNISALLLPLIIFNFFFPFHAIDAITRTNFISDIEKGSIVSSDGSFKLGFFSPGTSRARYVGIWFNKISEQTVVWVANRGARVKDSEGIFKIGEDGNLAVFCCNESRPLWSTNVSVPVLTSTAKLLDSGNLVLVAEETVIWQSFDYPTDTILPGMKFGINWKIGINHVITSWKSIDDPGPGEFYARLDPDGIPQFFLYKNSGPYWRGGPWNGRNLNGVPDVATKLQGHKVDYSNQIDIITYTFVNNEDESYMKFSSKNGTLWSIIVLEPMGTVKRLIWHESHKWGKFWMAPEDLCDEYARCGANAVCNEDTMMHCACLPGFEPLYPQDWYLTCVETKKMDGCGKGGGEGFVVLKNVKLPDARISTVYHNMSLEECERECLKICNCSGYATLDVNERGKGCIVWYGELKDMRQYKDGQDFYLRVNAAVLAANAHKNSKHFPATASTLPFIVVIIVVEVLLIAACFYYMWRKHSARKGRRKKQRSLQISLQSSARNLSNPENSSHGKSSSQSGNVELTFFDLSTVIAATNNFSSANKLGRGGFGPVYKGQLLNGQKIAVKRLSEDSGQGIDEFKNEVLLVAKLQHRNLVRLLGCCIEEDEKILIYEFMPNKSLNNFIFDQSRKLLDWEKRFDIILGIARGILYLHEDSRLRIIHRDLKASNILLDEEMKPKISDFGTARIFGGDQTQANTKRVVGTFGYMSPEYVLGGLFSMKSDVFSFGVLLLEIISGKKNREIFHDESSSNLIRHTWELWRDDKALEIVDSCIADSCPPNKVLKCIHVALLCVQDYPGDRPNMSTVVFMLSNETILPSPKQPLFTIRKSELDLPNPGTNSINEQHNPDDIFMGCNRAVCTSALFVIVICHLLGPFHALDTITRTHFISDTQNGSIVSSDGNYRLGFFSPGKSQARYVGIWLNKISQRTVVWVANRETPIKNSAGVFKIGGDGNLAVLGGNESSPLWSTNVSVSTHSSTAKLLDSGNLILVAKETIIWQSFDYPTDTILPGMRFGLNRKTGLSHILTSWKSIEDPAPGEFSARFDPQGILQFFLYKSSVPYWRCGPWDGRNLNGVPSLATRLQGHKVEYSGQIDLLNYTVVDNENESYLAISSKNGTLLSIAVLEPIGNLKRLIWHDGRNWGKFWMAPQDLCDEYDRCGANEFCNDENTVHCTCLPGFQPSYPQDIYLKCAETRKINGCGKGEGEGFVKLETVKLPDAKNSTFFSNMDLKECERECLKSCNCTGYAILDVTGTGRGCITWYGDLRDIRHYQDGQDFYMRVDAVELAADARKESKDFQATASTRAFIVVPIVVEMLLVAICFYYLWRRRVKRKGLEQRKHLRQRLHWDSARSLSNYKDSSSSSGQSGNIELTLFELNTMIAATDHFSSANKLGRGGFGPVYRMIQESDR